MKANYAIKGAMIGPNKNEVPFSYNYGWMANLLDTTNIMNITMPGTSSSMALYDDSNLALWYYPR